MKVRRKQSYNKHLIGDFNLVIDTDKDKKGGQPRTHRHSLKIVQDIAEKLDLTDIWKFTL